MFEAPDATKFVVTSAATLSVAKAIARNAGGQARIFSVRPVWSTPAPTWVAADPEFWRSYPPAK